MIQVIAINNVKKEKVDDYLATAKELVEKTNAFDKGCIKYQLCKDINDPLRFVMVEAWDDKSALDEHMKADHFIKLVPKLRECTTKPSEMTLLETMF